MSKNPRKQKRADQYDETDSLTYTKNTDEYPRGDSRNNKKKQYPFDKYHFQEDNQGGLINSDRHDQSFYDLAKDMGFQKTADNDIFDKYMSSNKDYWIDITFFKRAYQHMGKGDVTVMFGKSASESQIIRRRFASVEAAGKGILKTLYPLIKNAISQPQTPTDSDSLSEHQGYNPAAAYPYLKRREELTEKETDGGMDVNQPSQKNVKRSPFLFEDETVVQTYANKKMLKKIAKIAWNPKSLPDAKEEIKQLISEADRNIVEGTKSIEDLQTLVANSIRRYKLADDLKAKLDQQYDAGEISLDEYLTKVTELGLDTPAQESQEVTQKEEEPTEKPRHTREQLEHALSDKPQSSRDYNMGVYMALSPIYSIIANPGVFEALAAQGKGPEELKRLVAAQIERSDILIDDSKKRFLDTLEKFDFTTRKGVLNFLKFLSNALLKAMRRGVYPRNPYSNPEIEVSKKTPSGEKGDHAFSPKLPPVEDLFEYNEGEEEGGNIITSSDIHVKVYGNINDVMDVHLGVDELGLNNCHGGYTPEDGYFITTSLGYAPLTVRDAKVILDKIKSGASSYFHDGRISVFSAEINLNMPADKLNKTIEEGSQYRPDPEERGFKSLLEEAMQQLDNPSEAKADLLALYYGIKSRGENAPQTYLQALPQIEEAMNLVDAYDIDYPVLNQGALDQFQVKMQEIYNTLTKSYGPGKNPPPTSPTPAPTKTPVEKPTEKQKRWQPPTSLEEEEQEAKFKGFQEEQGRREKGEKIEETGEKQRKTFEDMLAKQKVVDMMSAMIQENKLPKEVIEPLAEQFPWISTLIKPEQLVSTEEYAKTYKPKAPEIKKQTPTPKTPAGRAPVEMTPEKAQMLERTMKGELPKPQTLKRITPDQIKEMQERMKGKSIPTPKGVPPKRKGASLSLKSNVIIDPATGQPFAESAETEQSTENVPESPENLPDLLKVAQQEAQERFQALYDRYHAQYPNATEAQLTMHIKAQLFRELVNKHVPVNVVRQILGIESPSKQQTPQIAKGLGQALQGAFEESKSIAKNLSLKKHAALSWNDLSSDEQAIAKNFANQIEREFDFDAAKLAGLIQHPMFPFSLESRIEKSGLPSDLAETLTFAVHDLIALDIHAFDQPEKFKQVGSLDARSQMTTHQTIENAHADINKNIPLEVVEEENPVVKEQVVELTVTKTSAVNQQKMQTVIDFLMNNLEQKLMSLGHEAQDPSKALPVLENFLIDTLKSNKEVLVSKYNMAIQDVADALDTVAKTLFDKSQGALILDVNSVVNSLGTLFPEAHREKTHELELTSQEAQFLDTYTSDQIWEMAQGDPRLANTIIARDLIERGIVASNTRVEKTAEVVDYDDARDTAIKEGDANTNPTGTQLSQYAGPADGPFKCSNCIHFDSSKKVCKHPTVKEDPEIPNARVEPDGCCKFVRHASKLNLKKSAFDREDQTTIWLEEHYYPLRDELAHEMFEKDFWDLSREEQNDVSNAAWEALEGPEYPSEHERFGM